jgi:hypothetical protein
MTAFTLIDAAEVEVDADVDGDRVRVGADDLRRATGWELKPEGLCRGEICVPFRSDGDRIDIGAVAEALGRAFVATDGGGALAGDPMGAGRPGASIDELELPGVDGRPVRMADTAGRKRLLIAWASW